MLPFLMHYNQKVAQNKCMHLLFKLEVRERGRGRENSAAELIKKKITSLKNIVKHLPCLGGKSTRNN